MFEVFFFLSSIFDKVLEIRVKVRIFIFRVMVIGLGVGLSLALFSRRIRKTSTLSSVKMTVGIDNTLHIKPNTEPSANHTQLRPTAVSYTHLTLPTIYSV